MILAATMAAALLTAAPAAHAAPTRTAQAFVDALKAAQLEARAVATTIEPAIKQVEPCVRVAAEAPAKHAPEALALGFNAVFADAMIAPLTPTLTRLQAAFDAIPTQDPVLRSVRATWRVTVGQFTAFGSSKPICDALAAWKAAGWKPSARPDVLKLIGADQFTEKRNDAFERTFKRAERRLRALGVSKRDARLIRGDDVVKPVTDRLDKVLEPFFETLFESSDPDDSEDD